MDRASPDRKARELPLPYLVEMGQGGGSSSYARMEAAGDSDYGGGSRTTVPMGAAVLGCQTQGTCHAVPGYGGSSSCGGISFLTDPGLRDATGVALAFTFRWGGVSEPPFDSLNLNRRVGDDPSHLDENIRRLLDAMGLHGLGNRLVNPVQVHGTRVLVLDEVPSSQRIDDECDAVATALAGIPVMLGFADCVPIVLVAPDGAFCVVHSGWRGTLARISAVAVEALCRISHAEPSSLNAYIGPHIGACCYEVSDDLLRRFMDEFGPGCEAPRSCLDLEFAVRAALADAGVMEARVASAGICTAHDTGRCFSHRAEHGHTGRFAALCCRT